MSINKRIRLPILAITFSVAVLVLGKLILFPGATQPELTTFDFPEEVPLARWRISASIPLIKPTKKNPELISQRRYRYIQNNQRLDIEMYYLNLEYANFNLDKWTPITSNVTIRRRQEVGFYGLGVHQQQAYLSSCINPRGRSTFTNAQFNQNRYFYDIRPQYLLSWLIGKNSLLDRRCIWVNLSLPLNGANPESAYQVLENAWIPWYQWWQSRFPGL